MHNCVCFTAVSRLSMVLQLNVTDLPALVVREPARLFPDSALGTLEQYVLLHERRETIAPSLAVGRQDAPGVKSERVAASSVSAPLFDKISTRRVLHTMSVLRRGR